MLVLVAPAVCPFTGARFHSSPACGTRTSNSRHINPCMRPTRLFLFLFRPRLLGPCFCNCDARENWAAHLAANPTWSAAAKWDRQNSRLGSYMRGCPSSPDQPGRPRQRLSSAVMDRKNTHVIGLRGHDSVFQTPCISRSLNRIQIQSRGDGDVHSSTVAQLPPQTPAESEGFAHRLNRPHVLAPTTFTATRAMIMKRSPRCSTCDPFFPVSTILNRTSSGSAFPHYELCPYMDPSLDRSV